MKKESPAAEAGGRPPHPWAGLFYGFFGILSFSLTLPATRLALRSFDPVTVGLGREMIAAVIAGAVLLLTRSPWPTRAQWKRLAIVSSGGVVAFPLFVALAMARTDASHGAVILALLPMGTAIAGAALTHERPSLSFWLASLAGSATVILFSLSRGSGSLGAGDFWLIGAVLASSLAYAEGGRLAREMGGWQVISWATVMAAPFLAAPVALLVWKQGLAGTPAAWAGLAYVSIFSAYLGFFGWFHGLAVGGIARVSQLQLIQPFLTLGFASLLLGEKFTVRTSVAAVLVALSILVSRRSKIAQKEVDPA